MREICFVAWGKFRDNLQVLSALHESDELAQSLGQCFTHMAVDLPEYSTSKLILRSRAEKKIAQLDLVARDSGVRQNLEIVSSLSTDAPALSWSMKAYWTWRMKGTPIFATDDPEEKRRRSSDFILVSVSERSEVFADLAKRKGTFAEEQFKKFATQHFQNPKFEYFMVLSDRESVALGYVRGDNWGARDAMYSKDWIKKFAVD